VCQSGFYKIEGFCTHKCPADYVLNEVSLTCNKCYSLDYMLVNEDGGPGYDCVLIPSIMW